MSDLSSPNSTGRVSSCSSIFPKSNRQLMKRINAWSSGCLAAWMPVYPTSLAPANRLLRRLVLDSPTLISAWRATIRRTLAAAQLLSRHRGQWRKGSSLMLSCHPRRTPLRAEERAAVTPQPLDLAPEVVDQATHRPSATDLRRPHRLRMHNLRRSRWLKRGRMPL